MTLKAYCGLPRNGKSYEVVSSVIYPAIASGRRVISNIAGLNQDEFYKLILKEKPDLQQDQLGKIIPVTPEQISHPDFWLTAKNADKREHWQIQAGDLVALDEIWRFWNGFGPTGDDEDFKKRPDSVVNFFRMHGHYTHPVTGITCDIVLITQDPKVDFHRQVKGIIEQTYLMTKYTALGSSNRYKVEVFLKTQTHRKPIIKLPPKKYDKKYFPLYQSHSQKKDGAADAKEVEIDGRGNVLKHPLVLSMPFLLIGLIYLLKSFFNTFSDESMTVDVNETETAVNAVTDKPKEPIHIQNQATFNDDPNIQVEPEYQFIGTYTKGKTKTYIFKNSSGEYRHLDFVLEVNKGSHDREFKFEESAVNSWSKLHAKNNTNTDFFPTN